MLAYALAFKPCSETTNMEYRGSMFLVVGAEVKLQFMLEGFEVTPVGCEINFYSLAILQIA